MSKFIGIVSAYAYAVSQGYTGTEEEYAELMASYATVAEEAAESAESAQASASRALVSAEKTQSDRQIVELAKSDVLSAVSDAQSYATTAQSVSQAIQDMNVEAVTLEPDFDATIEKIVNSETGVITLKYGIPKGAKGRITFSDDGTGNIVIQ